MEDTEKFVHAINNEKKEKAKKILEKILKAKVAKKIKKTLEDQTKNK